jgi:large subunit ribosomal protein L25
MSRNYAMKAAKRDRAGKGVARALRRENSIPAVIYGENKPPVKISLPAKDINLEYRKGHMFTHLCDMEVEGEKHLVLARDIQLHPVSDAVIHADFLRVGAKTTIPVFVSVHFINHEQSPGLKAGGVLNVVRHEVELMCSAMDIPDYIEADLSGKEIGDAIKISSATLPKGTKTVIDRDFVLATLQAPKKIEEELPVAPAEGAAEAAAGAEGTAAAAAAPPAEEKQGGKGKKE